MSLSATTTLAATADAPSRGESIVRVRSAMADWLLKEGWKDAVLGPSAPDWFTLEDDPRADLVKPGHERRIWRATLNERTIFAKVFEIGGGVLARLSRWTGTGIARREWRASQAAEWRRVPAVHYSGLGMDRGRRGRAVLLSEGLPNALALSQAWERDTQSHAAAVSLIDAVARLFASAHNRGFVHRDAHPGNILVQSTPDGGCRALFVDVRGAYFAADVPPRRRVVRSLAQLDHYFQRHASRSQRWRFLQSYVSLRRSFYVRGERRTFYRELLSSIAAERAAHARMLARQRDRRVHRTGRYFATAALGNGWKGTFVLQLARRHVFPESGVPDRSEQDWRSLVLPVLDGRTRDDDSLAARNLCIERARPIGIGARMWWSLTGSPHRKAFIQSHRLRHRDVPSELILACLEHRTSAGLIDESVLVRAHRDAEGAVTPRG